MPKILPFHGYFPRLEAIENSDVFFSKIKFQYSKLSPKDFFQAFEKKSFCIHEVTTKHGVHTGVIGGTPLKSYGAGEIKKHELTLSEKEKRMRKVIIENQAQVKPILLAYPKVKEIHYLQEELKQEDPSIIVNFNGEVHRYWIVDKKEDRDRITKLFKEKVPNAYIADGHHRIASIYKLYKEMKEKGTPGYKTILSAYYAEDELQIFPFNRILKNLGGHTKEVFLEKLKEHFEIKELGEVKMPSKTHELLFILGDKYFILNWKESLLKTAESRVQEMDAFLLNHFVFKLTMGIEDVRSSPDISYVEGCVDIQELRKKMKKEGADAAFCLFPIDFSELVEVSDLGQILPPKSTWFEPRIRNGFTIMPLKY